jgi:hypothetical protein
MLMVETSIPDSHRIWQVRQCDIPLIVMRHSKQIPIPHNGPRGIPFAEMRQACPACMAATATVVPGATSMETPLTFNATRLGMNVFLCAS